MVQNYTFQAAMIAGWIIIEAETFHLFNGKKALKVIGFYFECLHTFESHSIGPMLVMMKYLITNLLMKTM